MPELRQNYVTREWVIIASERAKRPSSYAEAPNRLITADRPEYDPRCPFCLGNEELDLEVERFPAEGQWMTRVVRNKFPALASDGVPIEATFGIQTSMPSIGFHEVLVNHPRHNMTLALMDPYHVQVVFETMQRRGRHMVADSRVQQVIFFKNHGERAGASLMHSHCQLIGLPVVPDSIRRRIAETRRAFEERGENPILAMLEHELTVQERLVTSSQHFVAFVLYAAASPFHTWIVPRTARSSFLDVPPEELADLAGIVRDVLRRLYVGLHDPDYNMIIRTAPVRGDEVSTFHWYISIVPRLSRLAGFELGSGMYINPSLPEACASFLRILHNPD